MEFDFDPAKDEANRFKHGLRLMFGAQIFDDPFHQILPSFRKVDGEDRYKAVGIVGARLYTAVYVVREGRIRLISVRRSNMGEQRDYDRYPG
ncbi:MAG: BrnT family toxin [Sphingomonadaceae bacterium]